MTPLAHRRLILALSEGHTLIDRTLTSGEAERAAATLDRLRRSGLEPALTGGLAIAQHACQDGHAASALRPLHDLDLVVEDIRSVPDGVDQIFEVWHVHADAAPGRMLIQLYDRSTALRIDVFGAQGDTLARCVDASLRKIPLRIVSREDLVARLGSLLLDLALGEAVAPKHARDSSALVRHIDASAMARAWKDHRRGRHPVDFDEARATVLTLVGTRPDLLVDSNSPYLRSPCPRCRQHPKLGVTRT